jgi:hypothetical protein
MRKARLPKESASDGFILGLEDRPTRSEDMLISRIKFEKSRVYKLQRKVDKLKSLLLLTDPAVSNETMNSLTQKQWLEFIRCFPEEQ